MKRFKNTYFIPVELIIEISDEEEQQMLNKVEKSSYNKERAYEMVLEEILGEKFTEAEIRYEEENDIKLEECPYEDIEEI